MANQLFQHNTVDINALWYYSHKSMLEKIAVYLGVPEKIPELTENILGKKLKIKKQKDPLQPKKAKSGFLFFCDEFRPVIKEKFPKYSMGDTMKELGKMWGECTDKDKYIKLSNNDKDRYYEELEVYQLNN